MRNIRILRESDGAVLFSCQANSIRQAVEKAIAQGVSLAGADLEGQDLRGGNFRNGDFTGAVMDDCLCDAADFSNAGMDSITATGASATYAKFTGDEYPMTMRAADWTDAALDFAIFQNIALGSSTFTGISTQGVVADAQAADDLAI